MIEMNARTLRVQRNGTLETRNSLPMATSSAQDNADRVPAQRRLRDERECSRDGRQCFIVAVEPREPTCQLRLRLRIVRIDCAGLTNLREPLGDATALGREDAALENRRRPSPSSQACLRDRSGR